MPGNVGPTQAEAMTMIAVPVTANDVAVGFGGAGGYLEMNVYTPLINFNVIYSITSLADGCKNFRKFLVEGTKPNRRNCRVRRTLAHALNGTGAGDRLRQILQHAHDAADNDLTLKAAALKLGYVSEQEFDRVVAPAKMVQP